MSRTRRRLISGYHASCRSTKKYKGWYSRSEQLEFAIFMKSGENPNKAEWHIKGMHHCVYREGYSLRHRINGTRLDKQLTSRAERQHNKEQTKSLLDAYQVGDY